MKRGNKSRFPLFPAAVVCGFFLFLRPIDGRVAAAAKFFLPLTNRRERAISSFLPPHRASSIDSCYSTVAVVTLQVTLAFLFNFHRRLPQIEEGVCTDLVF
ncbi:unnamed protein product [Linum trigynum]|uniref:Secreted protein n=1 Tax=Linum trigynum TaxID=586398 RepID=A0AAV2GJA9_9ROSI